MTDRRMQQQRGFTLTELMLSMGFVAFLLIFVVTATIQTMRIYNKGVAIRHINQSGRQLGEELTRTLRYANATDFANGGIRTDLQRVCANGVSYVWNIENNTGLDEKNKYAAPNVSNPPIRFVRVEDGTAALCGSATAPIDKAKSRDLISQELTVQKLTVTPAASDPRIVTIVAVISTSGNNRPAVDLASSSGFKCAPGGNGAFCAFGEFRTTIYIRN